MTESIPVSRYPVPELDEMPNDIRDRILAVQEKSGFIPNVFVVLAHRPDEFRAFFAYHDAPWTPGTSGSAMLARRSRLRSTKARTLPAICG